MGLPGSGKTTLASQLVRMLGAQGIQVFGQEDAVRLFLRRRNDGVIGNVLKMFPSFVWEPCVGIQRALPELHRFTLKNVTLIQILASVLENNRAPQVWVESILNAFYRQCAEYQLATEHMRAKELRVAEEGFVHRGFTLFGYFPATVSEGEVLYHYVDSIPLPLIVIFVDVSPEECWSRVQKRPKPPIPLLDRDDAEVIDQLNVGMHCLCRLADICEERGVTVFRISNGDKVKNKVVKNLQSVVDRLNELSTITDS